MTRRALAPVLVLAAPANGGDGAAQTVELAADPGGELAYVQTELTAGPGEITIELTNESSVPHDVNIEGEDAGTEVITNDTATMTTTVEAGEYPYFCSVPGHREAGMEGTLVVE